MATGPQLAGHDAAESPSQIAPAALAVLPGPAHDAALRRARDEQAAGERLGRFQQAVLKAFGNYSRHFELKEATSPELLDQIHALRYQVYCNEKGFEDAADHAGGREHDEWDASSRHMALCHRNSGVVVATVRLILHDPQRPSLGFPAQQLAGVDHQALTGSPFFLAPPRCGEISRFAISKLIRSQLLKCCPLPNGNNGRTLGAWASLVMMRGLVELSAEIGVDHWYTLMDSSLIRLLNGVGFKFEPIGEPYEHRGRLYVSLESVAELMAGMATSQPQLYAAMWGDTTAVDS